MRSLHAAALALVPALVPAVAGCREDRSAPRPSPGIASATASASATAEAASSSARPAVSHAPGTVPASTARAAPPSSAAPDAPPPTLTRLPAAKTRAGKDAASKVNVAFAEDGRLAVRRDAAVSLLDLATGAGSSIAPIAEGPAFFALAPDGNLLALPNGPRVTLWNLATGALVRTFDASATALAFSPDGKRLAVVGDALVVLDTASGSELFRQKPDPMPFEVVFGAGGKELVLMTNNVLVSVLSAETGAELKGGGGADTTATFGLTLSLDGRYAAASAPAGHGLQVTEVHTWAPRTLVTIGEGACAEHVVPEFAGRTVRAWLGSRAIKAFDLGTWKPYASFHAPPGSSIERAARDLAYVVVTREGSAAGALVRVADGKEIPLERRFPDAADYAFSPDGTRLVGTSGASLRVWATRTGKVTYEEAP